MQKEMGIAGLEDIVSTKNDQLTEFLQKRVFAPKKNRNRFDTASPPRRSRLHTGEDRESGDNELSIDLSRRHLNFKSSSNIALPNINAPNTCGNANHLNMETHEKIKMTHKSTNCLPVLASKFGQINGPHNSGMGLFFD